MAKTALVNKANKKPKFAVRGYTRCQRCGPPHSAYRKFALFRNCLRAQPPRRAAVPPLPRKQPDRGRGGRVPDPGPPGRGPPAG